MDLIFAVIAVVHVVRQSQVMRIILMFDFVEAALLGGLIARLWVIRKNQVVGSRPFLPAASLSWLILVLEGAYADEVILHQHLSFTIPLAIRLAGNTVGLVAILIQTLRPKAV